MSTNEVEKSLRGFTGYSKHGDSIAELSSGRLLMNETHKSKKNEYIDILRTDVYRFIFKEFYLFDSEISKDY